MTFKIKETYFSISVYFAAVITFALLFVPDRSALQTLICCILHEIGHLTAILLSGGKVSGIYLGAYGMRIEPCRTLRISQRREIIISLAGPLVNIILLLAGIIMNNSIIIKINTVLCLFNLIPIGKTDGYNALYSTISLFSEQKKAEAMLKKISMAFLFIIYVIGIAVFIKSSYNFSLLAGAMYLTVINTTGIRGAESI